MCVCVCVEMNRVYVSKREYVSAHDGPMGLAELEVCVCRSVGVYFA